MTNLRSWFLLITACIVIAWQIWCVSQSPWFPLPAKPTGDGKDYESIAFQLWQGNGWSVDATNPEWLEPYQRAESQTHQLVDQYLQTHALETAAIKRTSSIEPHGLTATTGRPPLYPLCIATIYVFLERGVTAFKAIHIASAICIALAGWIAAVLAYNLASSMTKRPWIGLMAALATLALSMLDRTAREYATDFLTEPLALLLMQTWVALWIYFADRNRCDTDVRRWRNELVLGVLLGLLILTRSIMVLWIPGLWVLMSLTGKMSSSRASNAETVVSTTTKYGSAFTALRIVCVSMAICAPWWIRNCAVLNDFMPLGTQGPITLLGGYCDESLNNWGEWQLAPEVRLRETLKSLPEDNRPHTEIEREKMLARQSQALVKQWIWEHRADLPRLAWLRLTNEWNPYTGRALLWKIAACIGLVMTIRQLPRTGWFVCGIFVLHSLIVMGLYSVGGRFLVPLYGMLYCLAGVGIAAVIDKAFHFVFRKRGEDARNQDTAIASGAN